MIGKLAKKLGQKLKDTQSVLVTAESCTGGWVARAVTWITGSSDWFDRGFVSYSDAAKRELLGVKARTLGRHGAVSEETAREMAAGALKNSRASISLSVTGVAGPAGGTPDKPVGMVCFAWARGSKIVSETKRFGGDRESVRRQSVFHALQGGLELL